MSTQLAIDFSREIQARDRGMRVAASAHHTDLRLARDIARELGRDGSEVWSDRVRFAMMERWPDTAWGNWAGSIFSGPEWEWKGWTRSKAKGSHANTLRTWVLRAGSGA